MAPQITDQMQAFIDDLLSKNKALFGDTRMEEPTTTEETTTASTETTEAATTEEGAPATTETTTEAKPSPEDELPDWAKKELSKVRGEAANYRTKLREAETKLTEAKTPEELAEAVAEMKVENARLARQVLVTTVATEFKLPAELAELLQGDDEAALKTHAEKLAKFAPTEELDPETLNGGLTPNDDSDTETDPGKLADKYGPRGRRR